MNSEKSDQLVPTEREVPEASLETVRYLHEHAYQRITWYRSELWKVSTLLWTAFAGFLLAAWQAASVIKSKHSLIAIAVFLFGSLTIWLYERYLRTIFPAIEYSNQITQKREIELCRMTGLDASEGFRVQDCDYGVWRATKPPLQFLFTFVSMLVLATVSLGIAVSN